MEFNRVNYLRAIFDTRILVDMMTNITPLYDIRHHFFSLLLTTLHRENNLFNYYKIEDYVTI